MAGIHGMRPRRFLFWDFLAASVSVPVFVALGYYGSRNLDGIRAGLATAQYVAVAVIIAAVTGYLIVRQVRRRRARHGA